MDRLQHLSSWSELRLSYFRHKRSQKDWILAASEVSFWTALRVNLDVNWPPNVVEHDIPYMGPRDSCLPLSDLTWTGKHPPLETHFLRTSSSLPTAWLDVDRTLTGWPPVEEPQSGEWLLANETWILAACRLFNSINFPLWGKILYEPMWAAAVGAGLPREALLPDGQFIQKPA